METDPTSPTSKMKFLCSHGGRILLRPTGGSLKYVGGETRAVAISRDITFSELMKKLNAMFEEGLVLKYQLASLDLDTLVSVRSNQDIKQMLEEHDRHQTEGSPMVRAFLFPSSHTVIETQTPNYDMERRYIDAINGIMHKNLSVKVSLSPSSPNQPFNISSACSTPESPDRLSPDDPAVPSRSSPDPAMVSRLGSQDTTLSLLNCHGNLLPMHTAHSSPTLRNPNPNPNFSRANCPTGPNDLSYIPQPHYYNYPNPGYQQHQLLVSYHSPKPPQEYSYKGVGFGADMQIPIMGRAEIGRSPLNQRFRNLCQASATKWYSRGGGGCGYYDDQGGMHVNTYSRGVRANSAPPSPNK